MADVSLLLHMVRSLPIDPLLYTPMVQSYIIEEGVYIVELESMVVYCKCY